MTAAELARHLGAQRVGSRWQARCPAHHDRSPSLAISEGQGGRVLIRCWAGCATTAVLAAIGLTWADVCGAPASPADRARLARERQQHDTAALAVQKHAEAVRCAHDTAMAHAGRLAARLAAIEFAGASPAYPGEAGALTAQYHSALDAAHDLEAA